MYRRFLSVRYLRTRFVNFLSVAGVMMGVAVMIVVTSVMDGFQQKVREVLRGTLSHLVLEPTGKLVQPDGTPTPDPEYEQVERALREDPDVVGVAPQVVTFMAHPWASGPRSDVTNFFLMQATGIDWQRETGVLPVPPGETEAAKAARLEKEHGRAVSKLADYLLAVTNREDPFADPVAKYKEQTTAIFSLSFLESFLGTYPENERQKYLGQSVEVLLFVEQRNATTGESDYKKSTKRLYVVGVYDSQDAKADQQRFYMSRADLREVASITPQYQEIRVALRDYDQAAKVKPRLVEKLSVRDPSGAAVPIFKAKTWEEVQETFIKAINNEKVMLLIVLSFIVMLACFTILATLTLTVVEKTRDIGVVRALGGTTGGVLSIFLRSGLLIGVIGGVLGLGLGVYVANHVNGIKDGLASIGIDIFPTDVYFFRDIPTRIEPVQIGWIVVGSMLVSFLAGLPPALRAARMDPVVALRHE